MCHFAKQIFNHIVYLGQSAFSFASYYRNLDPVFHPFRWISSIPSSISAPVRYSILFTRINILLYSFTHSLSDTASPSFLLAIVVVVAVGAALLLLLLLLLLHAWNNCFVSTNRIHPHFHCHLMCKTAAPYLYFWYACKCTIKCIKNISTISLSLCMVHFHYAFYTHTYVCWTA